MKTSHVYRRHIQTYVLKHTVPFVLLEIAAVLIILFFGERLIPEKYAVIRTSTYIFLLLLPFSSTRFPAPLMDKSYRGIIRKVEMDTSLTTHDSMFLRGQLYTRMRVMLMIDAGGNMLYEKAYDGDAKYGKNLDKYKEGDEVLHLYGTDRIVVLPHDADVAWECPLCGHINIMEKNICDHCNMDCPPAAGALPLDPINS